ncbi:MAG: hypothetical protein RR367_05440 [Clostridia bacterium]
MNRLAAAQAEALEGLRRLAKRPFFLRRAAEADALWVTDYPRYCANAEGALAALRARQIACVADADGLWRLDFTMERYAWLVRELTPATEPEMPSSNALHPAYALCRLLLLHPAPLCEQPLEPSRAMLKLCAGDAAMLVREVPRLTEACAARLRTRQPLPHLSGLVLAEWLREQNPA